MDYFIGFGLAPIHNNVIQPILPPEDYLLSGGAN